MQDAARRTFVSKSYRRFIRLNAAVQLLLKISRLQTHITFVIFNYVRRGLVENDKLIVASLIALTIVRNADHSAARGGVDMLLSPPPPKDSCVYPDEARR